MIAQNGIVDFIFNLKKSNEIGDIKTELASMLAKIDRVKTEISRFKTIDQGCYCIADYLIEIMCKYKKLYCKDLDYLSINEYNIYKTFKHRLAMFKQHVTKMNRYASVIKTPHQFYKSFCAILNLKLEISVFDYLKNKVAEEFYKNESLIILNLKKKELESRVDDFYLNVLLPFCKDKLKNIEDMNNL